MKIKYILVQLHSNCQYIFCNYSDVPVHRSEPYWRTLSHDHSDRIKAVSVTHLLEWTVSLEEDCLLSGRRVSRDRLCLLSRDCWRGSCDLSLRWEAGLWERDRDNDRRRYDL